MQISSYTEPVSVLETVSGSIESSADQPIANHSSKCFMCTDVAIHCSATYRVLEFSLCQYANRPRSRAFPLLIVVTPGGATSQLDLTPISRGHQFSASRLDLDQIRNADHRFPQHLHQGRHLFVPLHIVTNLDVTGCEILTYDYRSLDPIPQLTPRRGWRFPAR
jgi:hypothetical protein